ncbi:ATP-dependent zinc metalloprotease FtsH, partial [bacterium]
MNKSPLRMLTFVVLAVVLCIAALQMVGPGSGMLVGNSPKKYDLQQLSEAVKKGDITKATWQGTTLEGSLADGTRFETSVPDPNSGGSAPIQEMLQQGNVKVSFASPPVTAALLQVLATIALPLMIVGLIYFLVLRPAQMGGNQALSFGKSKARRVGETGPKITFDDVAGIEEAKQELFEIVDFLKNTRKYAALGAKIPKGILLTGPPGVGKTYLARAIAGEAGVPFFHISGSDFVEMFVGVGAARVRDLFETAKAHRPSLIFVDEIDAVGRQRGAGLGGGHDEREQTLNQLLVEMDGFDPNSGVILIAATNRPDVLDPALLRPGRFDRQIVVDAPDQGGRLQILKVHAKGKPLDSDIDLEVLSRGTPGFTGADLANMLNEGALLAARRGHAKINQEDLEEALDRTIAGPQRRSRIIQVKEREVLAYHEAGHAVVGELLEHSDPVYKVTILPRGMSLGSTISLPEVDKYMVSEQQLLDRISMTLGGRVAEEVVYGEIWTGASNDLEHVTRIARAMVCEYGMSEKLGTLALGRRHSNPFLGRDYSEDRNYSEDVARQIDDEVRAIVDRCHQRATDLLTTHREKLDAVVRALLEFETLTRDEFLAVMAGEGMPPRVKNDGGSDEPTPNAPATDSEKSRK